MRGLFTGAALLGIAVSSLGWIETAGAQPRIVVLGSGTAAGVKSDGSKVAGSFSSGTVLTMGSTVAPSTLSGFTVAAATADFAYFAGTNSGGAARWNSFTSTAQSLGLFTSPAPSTGTPSVFDISNNGRYICGWTYLANGSSFRPWVWDANANGGAGQMVALPTTGNGQAKVVGNDGTVAGVDNCCGSANRPVIWRFNADTSAWEESYLPFDGGSAPLTGGDIYAINSAGTIIVGSIALSSGPIETARWTWNAGTQTWSRITIPLSAMVSPSWLAGSSPIQLIPTAVTDDGNTIVGIAVYFPGTFVRGGFTWKASTGLATDFYDDLVALNTPGISALGPYDSSSPPALGFAIAMTGDGQHIATYAGPQTGFGPPTLIDLAGGPCVSPTAAVVTGSTSIAAGENAYLNCLVTGSEPLSIQWRFNSTPINDGPSGTGSTYYGATGHAFIGIQLLVNGTTPSDSGIYDCMVTNACGNATRPGTTLTVNSGACCYYSASSGGVVCEVTGASICTSSLGSGRNGLYRGDGTACIPSTCDPVSGACCSWLGGIFCGIDVSTHCTSSAGNYVGNTTTCTPNACDAVSGACCYSPDGQSNAICTVELSTHCTATIVQGGLNGAYVNNGTTCSPTPCSAVVGACCYSPTPTADLVCSIQTSPHCTGSLSSGNLQGLFKGAGTACSPSPCLPAQVFGVGNGIGACCSTDPVNPDGGIICSIQLQANCVNFPNGSTPSNTGPFTTGLGGVFRNGLTCASSNCSAATGACWYSPFNSTVDAHCSIQTSLECTRANNAGGLFGAYAGAGTTCSPATQASQTGACCYTPPGTPCTICTIQPQLKCTTVNNGGLSGTFGGLGSSCTPNPACAVPAGACCSSGVCSVTCLSDCTNNSGVYSGDSTSCTPVNPCVPSTGACCRGATCATLSQAACTVGPGLAGAHFTSAGVACTGSASTPCCYADYNKLNSITVQDIFDFLNDWFAGSPFALTGGNGSPGALSVQNIFDFLNDWFSGGCT